LHVEEGAPELGVHQGPVAEAFVVGQHLKKEGRMSILSQSMKAPDWRHGYLCPATVYFNAKKEFKQ